MRLATLPEDPLQFIMRLCTTLSLTHLSMSCKSFRREYLRAAETLLAGVYGSLGGTALWQSTSLLCDVSSTPSCACPCPRAIHGRQAWALHCSIHSTYTQCTQSLPLN